MTGLRKYIQVRSVNPRLLSWTDHNGTRQRKSVNWVKDQFADKWESFLRFWKSTRKGPPPPAKAIAVVVLETELNWIELTSAQKKVNVAGTHPVRLVQRRSPKGFSFQLAWMEKGKRRFFSLGSGATLNFAESMQRIKAAELRELPVEDENWF